MKKFFVFILLLLFVFNINSAVYLITANRIQQEEENLSEKVDVIGRNEIEKMGYSELNDVMKSLSFVYVPEYSHLSASSIKFQGSGGKNVLFMIDGVMLNDPSGINRSFGLSNLTLENVESVEVVKGSESALYGTNSNTGVVNIFTSKYKRDLLNIKVKGGSFNTYNSTISLNKKLGNLNLYISGNYMNSEGYNISPKGSEKDGAYGSNIYTKVKYKSDKFKTQLGGYYLKEVTDYDSFKNMAVDSNNVQKKRKYLVYLKNELSYFENINTKFNINYSESIRNNEESSKESEYSGKYYTLNFKNKLELNSKTSVLIGVDYYNEFARQDTYYNMNMKEKEFDSQEFYAGIFSKIDRNTSLNFVGRYSKPSKSGWKDKFIYKAGLNERFAIKDNLLRLSFNYGLGINYPTLYQVYGKAYDSFSSSFYKAGNPDLKTEESQNFTVSSKNVFMNGRLGLSCSFSFIKYDDYIKAVYDENYHTNYKNIEKVYNKSYSFNGFINLLKTKNMKIKFVGSYTHNTVKDKTGNNEKRVPMIPSYKYNLRLNNKYNNLNFVISSKTIGDKISAYPEMEIDAYTLLNTSINYEIGKNMGIGIKFNNLFDLRYSQSLEKSTDYYDNKVWSIKDTDGYVHYPGYRTPGFNFEISIDYTIPF